jgi:carbonic anhydrase
MRLTQLRDLVTCMDARIDALAQIGLKEGDAHIIRNAGGVACALSRDLLHSRSRGTPEQEGRAS